MKSLAVIIALLTLTAFADLFSENQLIIGIFHSQTAVELEPTTARYIYVYAMALHSSGEIDDALDELRAARDRGVVDFDNGALLVTIMLDRGDVAGARSAYEELRADYPEHPQMISLLQAIQQSERATNP